MADSPIATSTSTENKPSELSVILKDLKSKVTELKTQLKPIIQRYHDGEIKTSKGVSFLEVKYQLMVQYITELAYYVHLKLSGKSIENHPVVNSLIELRVILDKMKPIENKLKYQIDKLVRTAVMGTQKQPEVGNQDPLAFKPNPMNLLARDEEEEEEEEEGEEEGKSGVYRPPKLAPVVYDESKGRKSKYEKDQERLRERSSRSRVIRDLMADMNDAPEEVDAMGGVNEGMGYGERFDEQLKEKDDYEENNYVRLAVTRKEKQRLKAKNRMRFETEFDNLNDFNNLVGIQDVEEEENERFKNVLNRKRQRSESGAGRSKKRSR
ncbi:Sas10/Utp3/C1D family-domain-containing protein [Zychaea mexicana]|uniref:Sas10/Utp3/C1D family-domain-containing protein n=1 Tax=Zychaea mexicana TaxID=64656 RepID=UPI0022FF40B5|nr:Sas10/Utp3/C1D family-domain-containing protein [Zychaea mexicana]KAI9494906.1 Sas10/Utp3/C1D family-domain-containing protein [Zychaea mexicana]